MLLNDQILQSVKCSIQEVVIDRNNVEYQDIVQQVLGIVKLVDDQYGFGSYGDVTIILSDIIYLVILLVSELMVGVGQFGLAQIGDDLGLIVFIEFIMSLSVIEGLILIVIQVQSLLVYMDIFSFIFVISSGFLILN